MLVDINLEDYLREGHENHTNERDEKMLKNPVELQESFNPEFPEISERHDQEFHLQFRSIVTEEFDKFQENFREWMIRTPKEEDLLSTPLPEAIGDLFNVQKEYLQLIEVFASLYRKHISPEQLATWNQEVTTAFSELILEFTEEYAKAVQQRTTGLEELFAEKSPPLILLKHCTGLLPVTGEVTGHRAVIRYEDTLKLCADAKLEKLFIDLSAVSTFDARGAQQFFLLIGSLKILGIKITLAGISPTVAKLFVQMYFDVRNFEIYPTLIQAMKSEKLKD